MLLSLVKKDFILVKKYALFMAAFCFLLPVFFSFPAAGICRVSDLFYLCGLYHISSSPVCFSERIPVSQSRTSSVCFSLSPAAYGTGKICVLSGPLCRQQSDLLDQYADLSGTWKVSLGNGCSDLFHGYHLLQPLYSSGVSAGI